MRDVQRQKVYDWEHKALKDGDLYSFEDIQKYVDHVWKEMGLLYPPAVVPINKNSNKAGYGNRMNVWFPPVTTQLTILHELAHSMTTDINGNGERHGARFVGMYMTLLDKFMGVNAFYLWASADKEKVKYERFIKPSITDTGNFYN